MRGGDLGFRHQRQNLVVLMASKMERRQIFCMELRTCMLVRAAEPLKKLP